MVKHSEQALSGSSEMTTAFKSFSVKFLLHANLSHALESINKRQRNGTKDPFKYFEADVSPGIKDGKGPGKCYHHRES